MKKELIILLKTPYVESQPWKDFRLQSQVCFCFFNTMQRLNDADTQRVTSLCPCGEPHSVKFPSHLWEWILEYFKRQCQHYILKSEYPHFLSLIFFNDFLKIHKPCSNWKELSINIATKLIQKRISKILSKHNTHLQICTSISCNTTNITASRVACRCQYCKYH